MSIGAMMEKTASVFLELFNRATPQTVYLNRLAFITKFSIFSPNPSIKRDALKRAPYVKR